MEVATLGLVGALVVTMPQLGDIKREDKQYKSHRRKVKMIWEACPNCSRERWVRLSQRGRICLNCHLNNVRPTTKDRIRNPDGYILIWLSEDDFFFPMAKAKTKTGGYVLEHRLIVAKALGRCLHSWEIIHHKKGFARDDNRYPETLQLVSDLGHKQITIFESRIRLLEQRVTQLEADNVRLERQLNSCKQHA